MSRIFGPKTADHPSIGNECHGCRRVFVAGDFTTLVIIGPGDDPEEHEKALAGRAHNAIAIEVHAYCAGLDAPSPLGEMKGR